MAQLVVIGLLLIALALALRAPFRALAVAVFFAPWAGFDVDVGLRVTAYLIFVAPLGVVFLLSTTHTSRAREALASIGFLWIVVAYAVVWSISQIPFVPDASIRGGAFRSPELRVLVQIVMFLIMISPIFLIPWLVRGLQDIRYLAGTYIWSIVILAALGWLQLGIWFATGSDPMPVGFVDNILGGEAGQRSGQFAFSGDLIYRMSSFGGEPKGLGAGLAVGLLMIQAGIRPRVTGGSVIWPFLFGSMIATFSTMAILAWLGASLVQLIIREKGSLSGFSARLLLKKQYLYFGALLLLVIPTLFISFPDSKVIKVIEFRTVDRVMGETHSAGAQSGLLEDFNQAVVGFLQSSPAYVLTGVGLGNVHLYADPFLPRNTRYYAGGTPFVAKSSLLRWISELGILSFAVFLLWWFQLVNRASRVGGRHLATSAWGGSMNSAAWGVFAFWMVSGYVNAQFFLLSGILLGVSRILGKGYLEQSEISTALWSRS